MYGSLTSSEWWEVPACRFTQPCISPNNLQCLIAKYHLKQKYQEVRNGSARIGAYTKAIQTAKNKIGYDYHVDIELEEKKGGVIQLKITASSRERANNVIQHIQGEFCDVSSSSLLCTAKGVYMPLVQHYGNVHGTGDHLYTTEISSSHWELNSIGHKANP